jgi:hypothetical protein
VLASINATARKVDFIFFPFLQRPNLIDGALNHKRLLEHSWFIYTEHPVEEYLPARVAARVLLTWCATRSFIRRFLIRTFMLAMVLGLVVLGQAVAQQKASKSPKP